jgi:hypothetical protein
LRQDELCASIRGCPSANTVSCRDCAQSHTPADIRLPGPCPYCSSPRYLREPCPDCEKQRLHDALNTTAAGQILARVSDIDAALQMRVHVGLGDITIEEFRALRLLTSERNKKQEEEMKKGEARDSKPLPLPIRRRK